MEDIVIIDYGSGNLHSAEKAFARVIRDRGLAARISVTGNVETVSKADRVVLPGVGAFPACMAGLRSIDGMVPALEEKVLDQKRPFLGICVGMQMLMSTGLEITKTPGLDWIPGRVERIEAPGLKVPHMGWNSVERVMHSVLPDTGDAYFVHSYEVHAENPAHIAALTPYGGPVAAAIARDNILGVQFHPEKSQNYGQALIRRFLEWQPEGTV